MASEIEAEAAALRAALMKLEWFDTLLDDSAACLLCSSTPLEGHDAVCEVGKVLASTAGRDLLERLRCAECVIALARNYTIESLFHDQEMEDAIAAYDRTRGEG